MFRRPPSLTSYFPFPHHPTPPSAYFPRCAPSTSFVRFWERNQPPWQVALSPDGRQLALMSNAALEVYTNHVPGEAPRLAASVLEGHGSSNRGASGSAHSVWRRIAWSLDGTLLAVVGPRGEGRVYTAALDLVCLLPAAGDADGGPRPLLLLPRAFDYADPLACPAGVVVRPGAPSKGPGRPHIVHVLSLGGMLDTYTYAPASPDDDAAGAGATVAGTARRLGPPLQLATLGFLSASGMVLVAPANVLLVAGTVASAEPMQSQLAVAAWRLTDTADAAGTAAALPYAAALEHCQPKTIPLPEDARLDANDQVLRLVASPSGDQVAVLMQRGALLILRVPSLTVLACHSAAALLRLRRLLRAHPIAAHAEDARQDGFFDVCWWDNATLSLADTMGATQLVHAHSLEVRTTETSQELPSIGRAPQPVGGALDSNSMPRMHILSASLAPAQPSASPTVPAGGALLRSVLSALHMATQSRYLAPPEAAYMRYTYTLSTVTAVRPAELLQQLMAQGDYAAALELAEEYDLDADAIYQAQWLREPVSLYTVRDLLQRIKDKEWSIGEALQSAPPDLATGQALYQHVLLLTTRQKVAEAGQGVEGDAPDDGGDNGDPRLEPAGVTLPQARLIAARLTALQLRDKLLTYERGLLSSEEFSRADAWAFMHRPLLEIAAAAACDGDTGRLELLLVRHGHALRAYYLALLSLLPETVPMEEYEHLLPSVAEDKDNLRAPRVRTWHEDEDEWTAGAAWPAAARVQRFLPGHLLLDARCALAEAALPAELRAAVDATWPSNSGDYTSVGAAVSWALDRVQTLTAVGMSEAAFTLAGKLASRGLPLPDAVFPELQLLVTLSQDCPSTAGTLSLDALRRKVGPAEVVRLLLQDVRTAQETLDGLRQRVLPYLRSPVHQDATSPSKDAAVAAEVQALVRREPSALAGLLQEGQLWSAILADANTRAAVLADAAYHASVPLDAADVMIDAASIMLEDEMAAQAHGQDRRLSEASMTRLQDLVRHGAVARLVQRLDVGLSLADIACVTSEAQARNMFRSVLRRISMRHNADWESILVTLKQLRASWLFLLAEAEITAGFARAALSSGQPAGRQIALAMMPFAAEEAEEDAASVPGPTGGSQKEAPGRLLSRLSRLVEGGKQSLKSVLETGAGDAAAERHAASASPRSTAQGSGGSGLVLPEADATRVLLQAAQDLMQTAQAADGEMLREAAELLALLPAGTGEDVKRHLKTLRMLWDLDVNVCRPVDASLLVPCAAFSLYSLCALFLFFSFLFSSRLSSRKVTPKELQRNGTDMADFLAHLVASQRVPRQAEDGLLAALSTLGLGAAGRRASREAG